MTPRRPHGTDTGGPFTPHPSTTTRPRSARGPLAGGGDHQTT
ncbi:hypothetical protein GJR88_02316 [Dietzia sp. DQ12-45-1b]|nr:hypothetical protein GJR88_02316 [Dietzia sp. DQ12-45-1b]